MKKPRIKNESVITITKKTQRIIVGLAITAVLCAAMVLVWQNLSHKEANDLSSTALNKAIFRLDSTAGSDGDFLPVRYTCDGESITPPLRWVNAPSDTKEFAIMMTTIPVDGSIKWSWVLYGIPNTISSLAENTSGVGVIGVASHFPTATYQPPCSKGPGLNTYTFTVYALSESPQLPSNNLEVTGEELTNAITGITIGKASLDLKYQRSQ
jgi:phosphatidylethanolamine-binding protein (PEBP) family uncharacterized protein